MTAILPRSVAVSQPRGTPRINKAHPLAKNLRFGFVPGVGSVTGVYQTVSRGDTPTPGQAGLYTAKLNSGGGGGTGNFPTFSGLDADTGAAFSVFVLGEFAAPGSATAPLVALTATSGGNGWKIGVNSNGAVGYTAYGIADYVGSASILSARSIGVTVQTGGNVAVFADGRLRDTVAVGGINSVTDGQFCIGSRYPAYDAVTNSRVALALYFDRVLTAAEQRALADNPWQLFEAESPRSYATAVATVAATATPGLAVLPRSVAVSQPRGTPRINRSNAFGKRTKFAYVAGQVRDVAGGLAATNGGTALVAGRNGLVVRTGTTTGTTNYLDFGLLPINTAFSLLVRVKRNAPSSGNYDSIAGTVNQFQNFFGILVEPTGNKPYFAVCAGNTNQGTSSTGAALSTTDYETLIATDDGVTLALYRNGQLDGTGTSPGYPNNNNGMPFRIGKDTRGGYPSGLSCDVSECYILDGALTASEVQALSNAPYQVFESEAPRSYATAVATVATVATLPGRAVLPRAFAEVQPQKAPRIATSNPLTKGALAVISAGHDVNIASGIPLTRGGSGFAKNPTGKGLASKFRNNNYLETETLPAIGAGAFVEFWYGVPRSYANGNTNNGDHAFLTGGSSADGAGISLGSTSINRGGVPLGNWCAVAAWPNNFIDSGEAIPLGVPTLIVHVRHADGATHDLWRDGRLLRTVTVGSASIPAKKFLVGAFIEDAAYWSSNNDTVLAGIVQGEWTAAQIKSFCANPWQLLESEAPRQFATPLAAATVASGPSYRALIWNNARISQITDAQLGTSLKPLVLVNGQIRQRAAAEGAPLILVNGVMQTLPSNASLLL